MTVGRKGPGRDSSSAKAIDTAEKHARWLEMRKGGKTYRAIAAADGVAMNTVFEAVHKALANIRDEPAEALRTFELECLDDLIEKALESFEHGDPEERLARIEQVRKLRADRRKILGLDAPTKIQDVTPPREQLWVRVREWLQSPSPELESALAECGWVRSDTGRLLT